MIYDWVATFHDIGTVQSLLYIPTPAVLYSFYELKQ